MKKTFSFVCVFISFLLLFSSCDTIEPENTNTTDNTVYVWQNVGTPGFANVTSTRYHGICTYGNNIYLIFGKKDASDIYIYKYNGTTWSQINTAENDKISYSFERNLSITTDASGNVYYCYPDYNTSNLIVKKYDGTSITKLADVVPSSNMGYAVNGILSIKNGNIYVAYNTVIGSSNFDLRMNVVKYNGTSWTRLGAERFTAKTDKYVQFQVASDGTPYVAFRDADNGNKLKVMKYNGNAWVQVGSDYVNVASGRGSDNLCLRIYNNTPYIAYDEVASIQNVSLQKFNGSNWEFVGNQYFAGISIYELNMEIAPNGVPYVMYHTYQYDLNVEKFNGTSWVTVGSSDITHNVYELAISTFSDNSPVIVYSDWTNSNKITVKKGVTQ